MRNYLVWAVLYYFKFFAKVALWLNRPYIIGIAGSVGKSSARNALHAILKDSFDIKVVAGNSETGVPLGILGISMEGFEKKDWLKAIIEAPRRIRNLKNVRYLIVEMGIDDPYPPKNMSYLLTIIKPDMAIDLNASATHTMQFEKLLKKNTKDPSEFLIQKIAEEDSKIITNGYTKVGIYNADDKNLKTVIEKNKQPNLQLLTFGKDKTSSIYYADYSISAKKTKFSFIFNALKGERSIDLSFPKFLLPPAYQETFASVILAALQLGLSLNLIKESLEKNFHLPKSRSSMLDGVKESLIIDSSYNSSKLSVLSFIDMLKVLREKTGRPTVFIMGDMRELGSEAQQEHEDVANKILGIVDELYCVGPVTQEFVIPIVKDAIGKKGTRTKRVEWYKNAIQLGLHVKEELPQCAIVLVKGSQNEIFLEEAVKFLLSNSNDAKLLTRQDDFWMKRKQDFFNI